MSEGVSDLTHLLIYSLTSRLRWEAAAAGVAVVVEVEAAMAVVAVAAVAA